MLEKLGTDRYSVEEIQAWMDEHNLEIKRKHVHRPHQVARYRINDVKIKGRVEHEGKVHSYIEYDPGVCGYEIITEMANGFIFTVWTTHCVRVTPNHSEEGQRND